MKKLFAIVLLISSFTSFAQCFHFYNGVGPSKIGTVEMYGYAEKFCFYSREDASGSLTQRIELSDYQGLLAIVGVNATTERRLNGKIEFSLLRGNANGMNQDFNGNSITIEAGFVESPTGPVRRMLINNEEYFVK